MRIAAFIPARGGSERIPGKNLAVLGGVPLLVHTIRAAQGTPAISEIWVSTDDPEIADVADQHGARVHARPARYAQRTSQIEDAVTSWLRGIALEDRPWAIALLQPTSPFRSAATIARGIEALCAGGCDSVVGVVADPGSYFCGRDRGTGFRPDRPIDRRPRTQDLGWLQRETGALYLFTAAHFARTSNRMGGKMASVVMDRIEGFDIDTSDDMEIARAIMRSREEQAVCAST
jgi:CMP-N,N'-diacetyllegionaminic acid synthase